MSNFKSWEPDRLVTIPSTPSILDLQMLQQELAGRMSLKREMTTVKAVKNAILTAMNNTRNNQT